jgi:hypothetical protein
MPFSIKSEHADKLLSELRELTGEGITEAITRSLETRLAELKRRPRADADHIRQLAEELRDTFALPAWQQGDSELSTTHGSLLYGDDGLPR